jgi:phosphatidate cytidylyltransferase
MTEKNHNLLVRLATAFLLLPLVIFLIWQGGLWFAVLIGAATALCALELNLLPFNQDPKQQQLSAAAIVSVGGAFLIPLLDEVRFGFVSAKLVLAAVLMISFADALLFEEEVPNAPRRVGMAVLGVVYPGLLLSALVRLRQVDRGEWWIILALVVTWWNDTGAYFAGRALGKRKLFPRISPSKTWEGAIGGAVASMVGALLVQHFWLPHLPIWGALLIGAGASVLGPLGDLSESLLKRAFGAKDSGRLLPGHGGMLDRLDALLFTAPFVLLCARLWSNG